MNKTIRLMVFLGLVSAFCRADDSSQGVILPAVVSVPPGHVVPGSAWVSLNGDQVRIGLQLKRRGAATDPLQLRFNFAKFGYQGEGEPYPERQFPELVITFNGQLAVMEELREASVGDKDVTALLIAADIDPWTITDSQPVIKHSSTVDNLVRAGALTKDPNDSSKEGDVYMPEWQTRRELRVTLPTAPMKELGLRYMARPAFALIQAQKAIFDEWLGQQCAPPERLLQPALHHLEKDSYLRFNAYAIPLSVDGQRPDIVRLTVTAAPFSGAVLLACTPDGAKIGPPQDFNGAVVKVDGKGMLRFVAVGPPNGKD